MTDIANILDKALQRLRRGESAAAVLADYPEYRNELEPLLQVAAYSFALPKKPAPAPTKRYAYLRVAPHATTLWMRFLPWLRMSIVPLCFMIVLVGTVYAGNNSKPGQNLFVVKKTTESIQLALIPDPEAKAKAKLAIIQDRIAAAELAIQTNDDPEATAAALTELSKQTQTTVNEVKDVAATSAVTKKDNSLLNSLNAIAQKQEDLLSSAKPSADNNSIVAAATKQSQAVVAETKKILATVNDQALATLPSTTVSITGVITAIDKSKIQVDKTTINLDDKLVIQRGTETLTDKALALKLKVKIDGIKNDKDEIIGKLITILDKDPQVKGDSIKETFDAIKNASPLTKPAPKPVPEQVAPPTPTNTATGSYIFESPEPVYTPPSTTPSAGQ